MITLTFNTDALIALILIFISIGIFIFAITRDNTLPNRALSRGSSKREDYIFAWVILNLIGWSAYVFLYLL